MRINIRADKDNPRHQHFTVFVNGQNCGSLCMSPADSIWFHHAILRGVQELQLPSERNGPKGIEVVFSGKWCEPSAEDMSAAVSIKSEASK